MAQAAAAVAKSDMFVWEGRDKSGKTVKGEMSGTSDALIKATLRRQGINPTRVKKKPKPLFGGGGGKAITTKDIAVFSRQMATMMSSGVPLVQSFEIVGRGHENVKMQELILGIKGDVEAGNHLADALSKYPLYFDDLYVNLVAAGEVGHFAPHLLPDERAVLFHVLKKDNDPDEAHVAALDLERRERLNLLAGTSPQFVATGGVAQCGAVQQMLLSEP